ncbi:MAG TPA: OmpH family outer membrane protein, partial [Tepidisphaeraceae bacterium]|nr:OmpH family outer membrane protein [Tepidisphaeraceae bacterium]
YKDYAGKYKSESDQLGAALEQKKHDIEVMVAQLKNTNTQHPSYSELSAKIDQASIELEGWQKNVTRQGEREKKQAVRDIFHHLQAATTKVATAQHIDLVLTQEEDELPNVESLDYQALMMNIAGRSVLFSSKTMDISNAVLTQADADYAAGKKSGSAVTPSPASTPDITAKPQGPASNANH